MEPWFQNEKMSQQHHLPVPETRPHDLGNQKQHDGRKDVEQRLGQVTERV